MGDPLTLLCILVGVERAAFPVRVHKSDLVYEVKDAIKSKKQNALAEVDAASLHLYLAVSDSTWLCSRDLDVAQSKAGEIPDGIAPLLAKEMDETAPIGDLIAEAKLPDPLSLQIHVLVVVPKHVPSITPPAAKKRKHCRTEFDHAIVIECHRVDRSDDETPIPLVLLSETFARFEQNCKSIAIGKEDSDFVVKLCHDMSVPYENEEVLAQRARDLLDDYLAPANSASRITRALVDGSLSDGSYRLGKVLALNLECKLQKGDSAGDPTMQNIAYYIKSLPDPIGHQIPCFLVDVCGPLLSVFGIVNIADEDAICEPLVVSFPLFFFDNEWLMVSLARVYASLKATMRELTNKWCRFAAESRGGAATNLDRLRFPYSAEINGDGVTLQYVEALERYVFVAKYHGGKKVIVKFAKRYGKEVHEYCASLGFGSALLYYEALPSGWVFVVMEKLPLKHITRRESSATAIRGQVLAIKDALKAASFVHGDLRENNVMWDSGKNRVVLIDFDRSGKDGVDTHPPFMNTEISWPLGAEPGKPLRVAHDAYWLHSMLPDLDMRQKHVSTKGNTVVANSTCERISK